jgi:FkbM family methyltransferase
MNVKELVRSLLQRYGYEITAHNYLRSHEMRRNKFLQDHQVTMVLDVGANEGQYGASLRQGGYGGKIISFEPVRSVFQTLEQRSKGDLQWIIRHEALGSFDGETEINIADFSQANSILSATGLADTGYWKGQSQERIRVRRLDTLGAELGLDPYRIWLKIDTQGFEEQVLQGGQNTIAADNLLFLEVELSIRQFYAGEKLFPEMLSHIRDRGFEMVSMTPVHVDARQGYVLQYDCIFIQKTTLDR